MSFRAVKTRLACEDFVACEVHRPEPLGPMRKKGGMDAAYEKMPSRSRFPFSTQRSVQNAYEVSKLTFFRYEGLFLPQTEESSQTTKRLACEDFCGL